MRFQPVEVVTRAGDDRAPRHLARLRNLSMSGCLLVLPQDLQPGAAIILRLTDARLQHPLLLPARVAWSAPLGPLTTRWQVGIEFERPSADTVTALARWLFAERRRTLSVAA